MWPESPSQYRVEGNLTSDSLTPEATDQKHDSLWEPHPPFPLSGQNWGCTSASIKDVPQNRQVPPTSTDKTLSSTDVLSLMLTHVCADTHAII